MPGGTEGKTYRPALLVCVSHSSEVAALRKITFADGTAAPEASDTVPLSSAVDCACAGEPRETNRINSRIIIVNKGDGKTPRAFRKFIAPPGFERRSGIKLALGNQRKL